MCVSLTHSNINNIWVGTNFSRSNHSTSESHSEIGASVKGSTVNWSTACPLFNVLLVDQWSDWSSSRGVTLLTTEEPGAQQSRAEELQRARRAGAVDAHLRSEERAAKVQVTTFHGHGGKGVLKSQLSFINNSWIIFIQETFK